jgi:hypothetical protein
MKNKRTIVIIALVAVFICIILPILIGSLIVFGVFMIDSRDSAISEEVSTQQTTLIAEDDELQEAPEEIIIEETDYDLVLSLLSMEESYNLNFSLPVEYKAEQVIIENQRLETNEYPQRDIQITDEANTLEMRIGIPMSYPLTKVENYIDSEIIGLSSSGDNIYRVEYTHPRDGYLIFYTSVFPDSPEDCADPFSTEPVTEGYCSTFTLKLAEIPPIFAFCESQTEASLTTSDKANLKDKCDEVMLAILN